MMKVHSNTALKIVQSGAIPAAKIGRGYVMLTSDVLRYIEQRIVAQTAEIIGAPTRGGRRASRRAGSRNASASAHSCAQ